MEEMDVLKINDDDDDVSLYTPAGIWLIDVVLVLVSYSNVVQAQFRIFSSTIRV